MYKCTYCGYEGDRYIYRKTYTITGDSLIYIACPKCCRPLKKV